MTESLAPATTGGAPLSSVAARRVLGGLVGDLAPVILGNIVGGGVFVALVCHVIDRRGHAA
jgi:formate/nitrite transporter FocA (FNT family)